VLVVSYGWGIERFWQRLFIRPFYENAAYRLLGVACDFRVRAKEGLLSAQHRFNAVGQFLVLILWDIQSAQIDN